MNRYIKVQLIKDGKPISKTLYTYKTSLNVQLGEVIQATEKLQGVVAGFEVVSNIAQPEKIKEIVGQIKEIVKPKKQEELDTELCDFCPLPDEAKGVHCYGGNPVMCEGSHCGEAYERYLEDFKEENGGN